MLSSNIALKQSSLKARVPSPLLAYGVAILAVGLAIPLTMLITLLDDRLPFILFFAAVLISTWYGGWRPGLLSIFLSALAANYFFLPPAFAFSFDFVRLIQMSLFGLVGLLIAWLTVARQKAEAVLFEQREQLRVTLASIGDAVIATDLQGRVTLMNAVAEGLTGFSQAEAAGKPIAEVFRIVNEVTRQSVESPVIKVIQTGATVGLANHTILIAKDGRELPIDDSGAPIIDDQGQIKGVVLVFRDITERRQVEETLRKNETKLQQLNAELEQRIMERTAELLVTNSRLENEITERKRAEEALAEERNLLRTLIDNLPDYIYVKDSQSRFITANITTAQGLGLTRPEELVGKTDFDVFPPELAAQYFADEQQVIQSGQPLFNREETTVYPAGERGWASTTTVPVRDQQGQVVGLVGISRNISERKRMEAELAEIQHRLMESLERERVYLAQELHDGPVQELYNISFGLSGLKEALSNETDLAQLTTIQASVQQVIQALRDTFTELRPPALAPYGLEKAILSHAEKFQERHPELKLILNLMPDGQQLPERIRLALFRIYQEALSNVVRHAQAQQVWVNFALEADQAILEVKDNGCGFRVPQRWLELARHGHLGLVGITERAEAIGGRLQIISTPGAGAQVRVIAPRTSE